MEGRGLSRIDSDIRRLGGDGSDVHADRQGLAQLGVAGPPRLGAHVSPGTVQQVKGDELKAGAGRSVAVKDCATPLSFGERRLNTM